MLEIKRIKRNPDTNNFDSAIPVDENYPYDFYWELYEDGNFIEDVEVRGYGDNLFAQNKDACKRIGKYKSFEFPTKNLYLVLNNLETFDCLRISAIVTKIKDKEAVDFISQFREGIVFTINADLFKWQYLFPYNEYKEILLSKISQIDFRKPDTGILYGLPFINLETTSDVSETMSIESQIEIYLNKIKEFHRIAVIELTEEYEERSFLTSFNFPKDLKVFCKQYLDYFAKFLEDLGINATSNLKEEAGKVLFSVTPIDNVEALDKIREALAVYLKLPESPIVYDDSFAAMRLQQQIENLQHSQKMAIREIQVNEKLLLAQSDVIREKNLTISQQQTVIENQDKIIEKISSKSIMMDSLENKEEFEKVFDGLEFGESKELKEKLGIKFNPITSIKSLGKKFTGKDDEITALNLSDET